MWLSIGQDKTGTMKRLSKNFMSAGIEGSNIEWLVRGGCISRGDRQAQSGRKSGDDEIMFIGVINMAVINNLFFGSPGLDFGFKETGSCNYGLLQFI